MITLAREAELRIVRDSEAQSGRGLFARIGPLGFDPEVHRELEGPMVHRPGTIWVLALDEADDVVACASLHTDRLAGSGLVEFDNAYVRPAYRQRGLHGQMFTIRLSIATELGATTARGFARPTARLAFEAHGFRVKSERGKWRIYERRLDDDRPL